MTTGMYTVRWSIDIAANSAEDAALLALEVQRDPMARATTFEVREKAEPFGLVIDVADFAEGIV